MGKVCDLRLATELPPEQVLRLLFREMGIDAPIIEYKWRPGISIYYAEEGPSYMPDVHLAKESERRFEKEHLDIDIDVQIEFNLNPFEKEFLSNRKAILQGVLALLSRLPGDASFSFESNLLFYRKAGQLIVFRHNNWDWWTEELLAMLPLPYEMRERGPF